MSKQAWTKERVTSLIKTAHSYLMDDSITRCRLAFRHMSPEQMQEMHGASGRTREEVLNGYEESEKKGEEAYDLIESAANALPNVTDPEAFMAAHDKLVAACEPIADVIAEDWRGQMYCPNYQLRKALAAVKEVT